MTKASVKTLLLGGVCASLLAFGSFKVGAQQFTDSHEEEHLRREAKAYSNGLKDGSLQNGLTEMDRYELSRIQDPAERSRTEEEIRAKNIAGARARLEKHMEILTNMTVLVRTPNGELVTPKTIHEPGPLSD